MRLHELPEDLLKAHMKNVADTIKAMMPPETLFVLIAFESEPGLAQYISNAQRDGIIKTLREMIERLERKQEKPRVPFKP